MYTNIAKLITMEPLQSNVLIVYVCLHELVIRMFKYNRRASSKTYCYTNTCVCSIDVLISPELNSLLTPAINYWLIIGVISPIVAHLYIHTGRT